jgi:hypothetical protein
VHDGSIEAMKVAVEKLTFDGFVLAWFDDNHRALWHMPEGILSQRVKMIEAVEFDLSTPSW